MPWRSRTCTAPTAAGALRRGALDGLPGVTQVRVKGARAHLTCTDRERDVLLAASDGSTVADVAGRLHLSEGTVRIHLSAATGKTGVRTRGEAVRLAEARGWL